MNDLLILLAGWAITAIVVHLVPLPDYTYDYRRRCDFLLVRRATLMFGCTWPISLPIAFLSWAVNWVVTDKPDKPTRVEDETIWVPSKGMFSSGYITRDEGERFFWWHEKDANYGDVDGVWESDGRSTQLWSIHPDNLPPLTISAHLSKFKVL